MSTAWTTDADLRAARDRFAAGIPGYVPPAAYSVARADGAELTFGHVNGFGAVRPLPAVVLASVCGYVATTGVFRMTRARFASAVDRLAPAEAATHIPHPNLWTWRTLLAHAGPESVFVAFYVTRPADPPTDEDDSRFRKLLATEGGDPGDV
jgi:hypothetical protein